MKLSVFSMLCVSLGMASAYSVSDSNQVAGNEQADNSPNCLKACHCRRRGPRMKLQIFSKTWHKGTSQVKYLASGRCYDIPSTGSAKFDNGKPGRGRIMFCAKTNCLGRCYIARRSTQFYPGNIPGVDLGAYGRSVKWTR